MKLVINISKAMYQVIIKGCWCGSEVWYKALKNGVPLKGILDMIRSEFDEYEDTDPIKAKYVRQIIDKYKGGAA